MIKVSDICPSMYHLQCALTSSRRCSALDDDIHERLSAHERVVSNDRVIGCWNKLQGTRLGSRWIVSRGAKLYEKLTSKHSPWGSSTVQYHLSLAHHGNGLCESDAACHLISISKWQEIDQVSC